MRKMIGTMAVATGLLWALPASAQLAETPPTAPAEQPAAAPVKNRLEMICRNVKSAGSRLGSSRECHTQEEWDGQSARLRGTGAPKSGEK